MKNVIIYARVSSKDQNVDMQLSDLIEYAKARKLKVAKQYFYYASEARSDLSNYKKLFERATGLESAISSLPVRHKI